MAVLVVVLLLLAFFLRSMALAAFSPPFFYFVACSASSFPRGSPAARNFIKDEPFLTSSSAKALTNANSNGASSPLYSAARASSSAFSYNLPIPDSGAGGQAAFLALRLHFFPFAASQKTESGVSISSAHFGVSVLNKYTVLPSFSPPSAGIVKEFFVPVPAGGSGEFRITFTPETGSSAFVNAVELFPAPAELLWNNTVTPVGATAANADIATWRQQALETVYRLNVGGPEVNKENDVLWRTWLPDDPFLFGADQGLSTMLVNSSTASIFYDGYTREEVAPDAIYRTQRAANVSAAGTGTRFNVTWTFTVEPRSHYLVRLHFCDYELLSSVNGGVGIVFNVFIGQDIGTQDLSPKQMEAQENQAFYMDYVAPASANGSLTVSIGMSSEGGFLNGLEIMQLRASDLSTNLKKGPSRRASKKKVVIITLPAVLGACVLVCAVLCLLVLRLREKESSGTQQPWIPLDRFRSWSLPSVDEGSNKAMARRASGATHISLEALKAATDNFHERNLIGVGGFGNVYRGVLHHDGTRVAVKRATRASKQGLPEFQVEIDMLSRIQHRHLVSLVGYCDEQTEMILVYEYMEKGTLRSHLYGYNDQLLLPWKRRLEICIGVARGLHYLHTGCAKNVIHRDVKSTNILLGDGFVAKVADFGLSRFGPSSVGETHVSTAVKGSFGYMDPEYFRRQQLTDRSDVYSFGVVLLEVLCARPVIDQALERDRINLVEWALASQQRGQLDKIVDPRIIGQIDEHSLRKFAETAERCLADYGQERPSMGDVLWNLEYCLNLQETHWPRDAFEDSGGTHFPEDVVVPRRVPPLPTTNPDDETVASVADDMGVTNSKLFSQLGSGMGR
ncbi:unnamed protein product [Urochloa decumbens]|uniref:Protein kinase domain-containing protein n=1 Tax=Urochloa decumbens TaxID=240449 RepID=A0ABC9DGN8_9POAL